MGGQCPELPHSSSILSNSPASPMPTPLTKQVQEACQSGGGRAHSADECQHQGAAEYLLRHGGLPAQEEWVGAGNLSHPCCGQTPRLRVLGLCDSHLPAGAWG